ncbi:very-short-patch-repair endonuclease [Sphingobium xanthum]
MLARAARMRREPTEAERLLWRQLRASQLNGYKFRRQATTGGRIVDFFCPAKGLAIEVDGDTHEAQSDAGRDKALRADRGFGSLRFGNREVIENLDGVLEAIVLTLDSLPERWDRSTTPDPSSKEEGSERRPSPL